MVEEIKVYYRCQFSDADNHTMFMLEKKKKKLTHEIHTEYFRAREMKHTNLSQIVQKNVCVCLSKEKDGVE